MSDPEGCVAKLCTMKTGERQMSRKWIEDRLQKMVPDKDERQKIIDGLDDGSVTRVYAQTDANGTIYNVINENKADKTVTIGGTWTP